MLTRLVFILIFIVFYFILSEGLGGGKHTTGCTQGSCRDEAHTAQEPREAAPLGPSGQPHRRLLSGVRSQPVFLVPDTQASPWCDVPQLPGTVLGNLPGSWRRWVGENRTLSSAQDTCARRSGTSPEPAGNLTTGPYLPGAGSRASPKLWANPARAIPPRHSYVLLPS